MGFKLSSLVADAVKGAMQQMSQPSYYDDPYAQADSSNWAPEPYTPPALDISPSYSYTPPVYQPPPVEQMDMSNWAPQPVQQPVWMNQPNYGAPPPVMPVFEAPQPSQVYGPAPLDISADQSFMPNFAPAPYSSTFDFGQEQVYRPEPLDISPVLNFLPEQPDSAEYVQGVEPAGSGAFGLGNVLDIAGDVGSMAGQAFDAYRNSGFVENFNARNA